MYRRKTPKSQQPYKSVYVGHNPHTIPLTRRNWPDRIRIISIDPGTTHYAIRVEERSHKISGPITTLLFDKVGLRKEDQELTEDLICPVYSYVTSFLDTYLDLFKTCHMVIVEKQLPVNYRAVRMSQHTISYFMIHLKDIVPNLAMFFEVTPQLKGRELGVSPNLNERGLKLWAVDKAIQLLTDRGDKVGLEVLHRKDPVTKRKEKKDDLSDTVCQIEALFSHFNWPLTTIPIVLPILPSAPIINKNTVKLNIINPVINPVINKPTKPTVNKPTLNIIT